ncbi:hypothetical protein [Streptomyces mobaraensis]|nr:hypothetical protein [Streptomyces mobaraensis]
MYDGSGRVGGVGAGLERVTVFATYAAVGLGILQRAHAQGWGCGT